MEALKERLAKKGWGKREIEQTVSILQEAETKKSMWILWLDEALIWLSLLIAILGNFVLSVVLVPFLLVLSGSALYATLLCLGAAFGMVFTLLLQTIEKIEIKKHIMAGVLIPIIGLINMYIIAHFSNDLIVLLKLTTTEHNPALISMVYIFAFLLPYLIMHYMELIYARQRSTA